VLVYTPATLTGPPERRSAELLPATLRLLARGLVAGAFCWDQRGALRPDWQMLRYQLHVADCGIVGVVAAEVDQDGWLDAIAAMGGRVEAPWATSSAGLARACADTAAALRQRSGTARALQRAQRAADDARALLSLWVPAGQMQQRVHAHYQAALDPSTPSQHPQWLVSGASPDVSAARALLAATPADSAHPLRVADDVHLLACCERIAAQVT
jgi:hypothetical protein